MMAETAKKIVDSPELQPLNQQNEAKLVLPKFGKRHIEIINVFTCLLISFCIKTNFPLTIVAMTDPLANENKDIPTFKWPNKNLLIAVFFIGYIIPQIPAGWMMSKYGPKWFLIFNTAVCAITGSLMPPLAIYCGSTGIMVCRILQGIAQGFFIPSIPCFISRWIPLSERGRFGSFLFAAGPLGAVISMLVTGAIAAGPYGWPMTFYFFSALGIVWCVYYAFFGYNSPSLHKSISEAEKKYVQQTSIDVDKKPLPTPWKHMAMSLPVWALLYSYTSCVFGMWVLMSQIPTYMSKIMKMDIKSNGALAAAIYLVQWAISILLGIVSDYITNRSILSRTASRKLFVVLGTFGPAICLLFLTQCSEADYIKGIALLMLGVGSSGANVCGTAINSVDLSVNHSGIIQGLINSFGHIFAIIAPMIVQILVNDEYNRNQWSVVFYLTAGVFASGGIIFGIFGSGKTQKWDAIDQQGTEEKA